MSRDQQQEIDRLREELATARRQIAELEQVVDQDPLVPLLNRRAFERELERAISFCRRYDAEACLVFVDLRHFKRINDTYGHAVGDAALLHVADVLRAAVRMSDTVGRLGGDEFGVILMQTDLAAGRLGAARLVQALEQNPLVLEGRSIAIHASAGVAQVHDALEAESVIVTADHAMYDSRLADMV